jgi:hypothetical protein
MGPFLSVSDIMRAFDGRKRTPAKRSPHTWGLLFATRTLTTFACTTEWRVT